MSTALVVLVLLAALGSGLVAGVFYGFSVLVMPALAPGPAEASIVVMQRINRLAPRPAFLASFVGTAVLCLVLLGWTVLGETAGAGGYLFAGGGLYLIGGFGLTAGYHVPHNDALDRVDPAGTDAATRWSAFHVGWTRFNHVRSVAAALAAVAFVLALHR